MKEKKKAIDISNKIGVHFPRGFSEANYDYETYQSNFITELLKENDLLRQGIQKFIDKNFVGGSKCDREDYGQMVSCKDIYDLRELIKE